MTASACLVSFQHTITWCICGTMASRPRCLTGLRHHTLQPTLRFAALLKVYKKAAMKTKSQFAFFVKTHLVLHMGQSVSPKFVASARTCRATKGIFFSKAIIQFVSFAIPVRALIPAMHLFVMPILLSLIRQSDQVRMHGAMPHMSRCSLATIPAKTSYGSSVFPLQSG